MSGNCKARSWCDRRAVRSRVSAIAACRRGRCRRSRSAWSRPSDRKPDIGDHQNDGGASLTADTTRFLSAASQRLEDPSVRTQLVSWLGRPGSGSRCSAGRAARVGGTESERTTATCSGRLTPAGHATRSPTPRDRRRRGWWRTCSEGTRHGTSVAFRRREHRAQLVSSARDPKMFRNHQECHGTLSTSPRHLVQIRVRIGG